MPFYRPVNSGYISDHILDTVLGDMPNLLGEEGGILKELDI